MFGISQIVYQCDFLNLEIQDLPPTRKKKCACGVCIKMKDNDLELQCSTRDHFELNDVHMKGSGRKSTESSLQSDKLKVNYDSAYSARDYLKEKAEILLLKSYLKEGKQVDSSFRIVSHCCVLSSPVIFPFCCSKMDLLSQSASTVTTKWASSHYHTRLKPSKQERSYDEILEDWG